MLQPAPGQFELNETARGLLDESLLLGIDLDVFRGPHGGRLGHLLSAVRTGKPAYHEAFGRSFWDDLEAHPPIAAVFDALMGPAGHGAPDPEVLVNPADWDAVHTVVDVGGGTGSLLAEILRAQAACPRHPGGSSANDRAIGRSLPIGGSFGPGDGVGAELSSTRFRPARTSTY